MIINHLNASAIHSTWSKKGVLIKADDISVFTTKFLNYNKPVYNLIFWPNFLVPDIIRWGKGIGGAFSDYQVFEIEKSAKFKDVTNYSELIKWLENYLEDYTHTTAGVGGCIAFSISVEQFKAYLRV